MEVEVKAGQKRVAIDYAGLKRVYLATGDKRLYEHPFGGAVGGGYPNAVAEIFQLVTGALDNHEHKRAFVRRVVPDNFIIKRDAGTEITAIVPIIIFFQVEEPDEQDENGGKLVLFVKVLPEAIDEFVVPQKWKNQYLLVELYLDSAMRTVLS